MNLNPKNGDRLTKSPTDGKFRIWDYDFNTQSEPYETEAEARGVIAAQDAERAVGTRA